MNRKGESLDFFFLKQPPQGWNHFNFFAFVPLISPLILFSCDESSPGYAY